MESTNCLVSIKMVSQRVHYSKICLFLGYNHPTRVTLLINATRNICFAKVRIVIAKYVMRKKLIKTHIDECCQGNTTVTDQYLISYQYVLKTTR